MTWQATRMTEPLSVLPVDKALLHSSLSMSCLALWLLFLSREWEEAYEGLIPRCRFSFHQCSVFICLLTGTQPKGPSVCRTSTETASTNHPPVGRGGTFSFSPNRIKKVTRNDKCPFFSSYFLNHLFS